MKRRLIQCLVGLLSIGPFAAGCSSGGGGGDIGPTKASTEGGPSNVNPAMRDAIRNGGRPSNASQASTNLGG